MGNWFVIGRERREKEPDYVAPSAVYVAGTNSQLRRISDEGEIFNASAPVTISCIAAVSDSEVYIGEEGFKANPRIYKYNYKTDTWTLERTFSATTARVASMMKSGDGSEVYAVVEDNSFYGTGYYEAGSAFSLSSGWAAVETGGYIVIPYNFDYPVWAGRADFSRGINYTDGSSWTTEHPAPNHYFSSPFSYNGNIYVLGKDRATYESKIYKGPVGSWTLVATDTLSNKVWDTGGAVRVDYSTGYAYMQSLKFTTTNNTVALVFDCNTDTIISEAADSINNGAYRDGSYGFSTSEQYHLNKTLTDGVRYYDGSTWSTVNVQNGGTSAVYSFIDGF